MAKPERLYRVFVRQRGKPKARDDWHGTRHRCLRSPLEGEAQVQYGQYARDKGAAGLVTFLDSPRTGEGEWRSRSG